MRRALMEKIPVSLETAQHVLWHFGDTNLGVQPGTFTERLLVTISAADAENRAKLREVFPELVHAFECVQREHWGLEWLRSKVIRSLAGGVRRPADLFESAARS